MVKFPPIKSSTNLSRFMAYKYRNGIETTYRMIDLKNNKIAGEMVAYDEFITSTEWDFLNEDTILKSYYIEKLLSYERNQGVGTALLNIAKAESKRNGCTGNIHLIVSDMYDFENPPYIFYKKNHLQMLNEDKDFDEYVTQCIKQKRQVDKDKHRSIGMYIAEHIQDQDTYQKYLDNFSNKFSDIMRFMGYK